MLDSMLITQTETKQLGYETTGEEPEYNIKGFKAAVEVGYHLKDLFSSSRLIIVIQFKNLEQMAYTTTEQQLSWNQTYRF